MVLVAPPGHALGRRKRVTVKQLAAHPLILREAGSGLRHCFEKSLERAGSSKQVMVDTLNWLMQTEGTSGGGASGQPAVPPQAAQIDPLKGSLNNSTNKALQSSGRLSESQPGSTRTSAQPGTKAQLDRKQPK